MPQFKDQADAYPVADADTLLRAATDPAAFKPEKVALPEIGQAVFVRRLNADEMVQYLTDADEEDKGDRYAYSLSHALCDAAGKRLFHADGDTQKLRAIGSKVAIRIVSKFREVNGLDGDFDAKK